MWTASLGYKPARGVGYGKRFRLVYGIGTTPERAISDARREWFRPLVYKNQVRRIAAGADLLKELGL